ncbi:MAG: hypothetical protein R2794_08500 [Chitinophagales bacterium]
MRKRRITYLPLFITVFLGACVKDIPVPSYVHVDPFSFTCDPDAQGYPSSKITDVWVYANNDFIGAYELPATLPVLSDNSTELILYPGIKENGISGTAVIYPFYTAYTVSPDLISGDTYAVTPSTTYKSSAAISFIFKENFNATNDFSSISGDVTLTTTSDPTLVFEGFRSGIATFSGSNDTMRISTSHDLTFGDATHLLYLEMDYMCDIEFEVWLRCSTFNGSSISDQILYVTPKDYWNKIYINLNPSLQFFAPYQPEYYNLEFRAIKPADVDTAQILFDNLKIIQSN